MKLVYYLIARGTFLFWIIFIVFGFYCQQTGMLRGAKPLTFWQFLLVLPQVCIILWCVHDACKRTEENIVRHYAEKALKADKAKVAKAIEESRHVKHPSWN